jgi:hypothetical protein
MRAKMISAVIAVCAAVAVLLVVNSHRKARAAGDMPSGHGITCLKADGQTPCGNSDVSDLNDDLSGIKKLFNGAKSVVTDSKSATGDAQQAGSDGKQLGPDGQQLGSDAKQLASDAKNKDLKSGVNDGKQAAGDAQTATSDAKTAAGDAQQVLGDAKGVIQDLKGIGSLSLESSSGELSCKQEDGAACTDDQTRALQAHASVKSPPLTIRREVDGNSN